ncbi:hypothetical protein [Isoptericola croceus]|uniref:hypothetical protein n=1 Tax=Isoptericola croceus TaxID=3031406 RepID=UPI0023F9ADC7|nr:hypothetical protein [Isoptericola croceus]
MTAQPPSQHTSRRPRGIRWPLVAGLASMALLWPLTGLIGAGGTGPGRAFAIIGLTALVWIGVVGFGHVARPVATLTLTGVAFGIVALVASMLVGGGGVLGDGAAPWTLVPVLAMDAFWGFVAGLLALAVQRALAGAGR